MRNLIYLFIADTFLCDETVIWLYKIQDGFHRMVFSHPLSLFCWILLRWNARAKDERSEWTRNNSQLSLLDDFTH